MRLINCLILLLFFVPDLMADHGIYFKSNEVTKENRTGIDITHNGNISYITDFTIHFKLSFRESETHYGEILSLKENQSKNLIQVTYRKPDIFVIHNKRTTKFHLNLEDEKIKNNRWIDFEIHIDAVNDKINLLFEDKKLESDISFPQNSDFALSLGVVNKYGFFIDEVPSISVKDISVRIDGAPRHLWPLKKTNNSLVKDVLSSKSAKVFNPDWVVDYHNEWVKIKSLNFPTLPSLLYDKEKELINFIFMDGSIQSFNPLNKTLSKLKEEVKGFPCFEKAQQIIYDKNGNISTYSFNKNLISTLDTNTNTWSRNVESSVHDAPRFWHHNKLLHPETGKITTIGGYGYYSYFNDILSFDTEQNSWNKIEFSGDTIQPRYLASLGKSEKNPNTVFLFGGLGNSMGKQILGKEFYYDLYKIDFEKKKIKHLWDYECDEQFQFLPINSMKLNASDSSFYTLMFPSTKQNTYLRAIKGFVHEPRIVFIGDSIPYNFLDIESFADLYYWNSENKLIAITSHQTEDETHEVNIYTISYEPGNKDDFNINGVGLPMPVKIFYTILAVVLVLFVALIVRKIRKEKEKKNKSEYKVYTSPDIFEAPISDYEIPKNNAIIMFGGFQVFDEKAKDITYRFSPTLKELFLLILLNTINEGKGISSKRIQEYLWPDKSESKAKNNRGVNIKKLRGILEDLPGTEIIFDNNYWKITLPENIFCDLDYVQKGIKSIREQGKIENLAEIIIILQRGAMLRDIFPEWLDSFKDFNTGMIVGTLEEIIKDSKTDKVIALAISNVIFEFDQMNETALKTKCCLLATQGKHSLAIETFEHYRKLYLKFYNEEYQYSFKDIVSKEIS
ncbi:hypothetical protein [Marinifilum caeruleilacunae]|uniref:Galactose oxidase n=1 Tax=Marinifilum caeruleilacunae TaxID=2499076 RepID=A0ABX1WXZ5_9BACT|nr:hypothetical protein [Marinifilum caeruleilacunae]NOU60781.1 hypothetical protein [Marinifilum caeruleilacunae]